MIILVLGRKLGEQIVVTTDAGQIIISVVRLSSDRVRIGFEADEGIRINRIEIEEAFQRKLMEEREC